jgi:hypothetical protein
MKVENLSTLSYFRQLWQFFATFAKTFWECFHEKMEFVTIYSVKKISFAKWQKFSIIKQKHCLPFHLFFIY